MANLDISNIINISVSAAPQGLGAYNTSNLALFTREVPSPVFSDGYKIYRSPSEVATDFGSASVTAKMAIAVFSQQPNILAGGGYLVVIPMLSSPSAEKLEAAILRTKDLVQYFGIMCAELTVDADLEDASDYVESLNKLLFTVKKTSAAVETAGIFETIGGKGNHKTRCLLYIHAGVTDDSLNMMAAYAGRALSVNFSGSNTTQTMHLKDLKTISADSAMTQVILEKCKTVGADVYASFQGVAKVFCTGGNDYFDAVYNLGWFVGAMEVAGFNALARVSTKLPQTEQGLSVLKGAYRDVCEQAKNNQYVGAGSWQSPETFGNQEDFLRNVMDRGYYIYSAPIAEQSQVDREARKAPLIQIAIKAAGAMHSSDVLIYVNA